MPGLNNTLNATRPAAGRSGPSAERKTGMETRPPARRVSLGRMIPLAVLVAALVAFFAFDLDRYVSFATLQKHHEALSVFVADNGVLAALLFVAVYAVATAVSLPGGAVLTITGGFLFGTVLGSVYVVVGATLGATAIFLAARTAVGEPLRARAGPALKRMEAGFRENALNYLLFLRLIPVFPFWLVNLVPAFLGVPLRTYVLGTFVGIIPGSVVYASVGNGVGALLEVGGTPDVGIIFRPEILLPILGLGVLALLPPLYKRFRGRKAPDLGGE